jgi:uncharacterized membrane protein YcaP (DUF421 family)
MFFDSWQSLGNVLVKGLLAYAFIVFVLRVTGKRTLSKMNAFDLIVTVALGSTVANILLSSEVTLAEGMVALGLLVTLQYVVTWLSVRVPFFQRLVKAEPRLLYYERRFLEDAMRRERISREEILAAARNKGIGTMDDVSSVILETDGTLSILGSSTASQGTLSTVQN